MEAVPVVPTACLHSNPLLPVPSTRDAPPLLAFFLAPKMEVIPVVPHGKPEATFNKREGLVYANMFDAILDTAHAAVNEAGVQGLELVVSETGWPSGAAATGDTVENSAAYNNNNVLRHVAACTGTPRQPGKAVEKYMFAMFNENQKPEGMEQQFGLFEPDMNAVYRVDFAGSY